MSRGAGARCPRLLVKHGVLELGKPILSLFTRVPGPGLPRISKESFFTAQNACRKPHVFSRKMCVENDMFSRGKVASKSSGGQNDAIYGGSGAFVLGCFLDVDFDS